MNDRCPHCGAPISLWTKMNTGVLVHAHCPKCDHSLRASKAKWLNIALIAAFAVYQFVAPHGVVADILALAVVAGGMFVVNTCLVQWRKA